MGALASGVGEARTSIDNGGWFPESDGGAQQTNPELAATNAFHLIIS